MRKGFRQISAAVGPGFLVLVSDCSLQDRTRFVLWSGFVRCLVFQRSRQLMNSLDGSIIALYRAFFAPAQAGSEISIASDRQRLMPRREGSKRPMKGVLKTYLGLLQPVKFLPSTPFLFTETTAKRNSRRCIASFRRTLYRNIFL